jgi:uncharacterized cupredoxin-like copper-binding protein
MFGTRRHMRMMITTGAALTLGVAGLQHGLTTERVSAAQAKPVPVKVTLRDFRISMSRHRLPEGRPIQFVITNRGQAMHEAILERAGADDKALKVRGKEYEADDIAPGTTRTVVWTVPQAGNYQLACHMPGHFEMGMKTTFTVTHNT